MATSDLAVVNGALDLLGVAPISAIGEDSEAGGLASRTYASLRDEFLASHPWGFATVRVQLAELSAPDSASGFTRRFQLPADTLRVIEVLDANREDWVVEGRELWTSISGNVWVRYIRKMTQPGLFSASFEAAFKRYLAVNWSETLTRSSSTAERLEKQEARMTQDARSFDGQQGQVQVVEVEGWIDER